MKYTTLLTELLNACSPVRVHQYKCESVREDGHITVSVKHKGIGEWETKAVVRDKIRTTDDETIEFLSRELFIHIFNAGLNSVKVNV